jgi:hypothetical protein
MTGLILLIWLDLENILSVPWYMYVLFVLLAFGLIGGWGWNGYYRKPKV